jgi:hypothetical protein
MRAPVLQYLLTVLRGFALPGWFVCADRPLLLASLPMHCALFLVVLYTLGAVGRSKLPWSSACERARHAVP